MIGRRERNKKIRREKTLKAGRSLFLRQGYGVAALLTSQAKSNRTPGAVIFNHVVKIDRSRGFPILRSCAVVEFWYTRHLKMLRGLAIELKSLYGA